MDRLVFVTEEMYGCAACNKKEKVLVLFDYYDTPLAPYCSSCFVAKFFMFWINELSNNQTNSGAKLTCEDLKLVLKLDFLNACLFE